MENGIIKIDAIKKGDSMIEKDGVQMFSEVVTEFLNILDLSVFVSGFISYGAIIFSIKNLVKDSVMLDYASNWIVVVIFSYALGIVSYGFGKRLCQGFNENSRKITINEFDKKIANELKENKIVKEPIISEYYRAYKDNIQPNRILFKLYIFLWEDVRKNHSNSKSYRLLSKYWTLSAIVEGLIASTILWGIGITIYIFRVRNIMKVFVGKGDIGWSLCILILMWAAVFGLVGFLKNENKRYREYQIEELIVKKAYEIKTKNH